MFMKRIVIGPKKRRKKKHKEIYPTWIRSQRMPLKIPLSASVSVPFPPGGGREPSGIV